MRDDSQEKNQESISREKGTVLRAGPASWLDLAAIALGVATAVLAHYLPDQASLLHVLAGGLAGSAIPRPSTLLRRR